MITTAELHELRQHMTPRFLSLINRALGAQEANRIRSEIYKAAGSTAHSVGPAHASGGLAGYARGGMVNSATPGRADAVRKTVERGSYIIPADVVAAQGQGNTLAGAAKYKAMVAKVPPARTGPGYAAGGQVPVRLSGGEFHIPPHVVAHIGGGNVEAGAAKLNRHVVAVRQKAMAEMSRLPPPHQ